MLKSISLAAIAIFLLSTSLGWNRNVEGSTRVEAMSASANMVNETQARLFSDGPKPLVIDPTDLVAITEANKNGTQGAFASEIRKYNGRLVAWSGYVSRMYEDQGRKCHAIVVTQAVEMTNGRLKSKKNVDVVVYLKDEKTEENLVKAWAKKGKDAEIFLKITGRMGLEGPRLQSNPRFASIAPGHCFIEDADAVVNIKGRQ